MTTQRKAKRKLSNISFEHEGAHVALVSKTQDGPANGHDYALVMKAANFSEEFVEKASKIKVTMDIEDFLCKFFGLWYDEAELLARLFGFETKSDEMQEEAMEYDDYIKEKLSAFEILKGAYEAESLPSYLAGLTEEEYLAMLTDQQFIEKAFKKQERLDKAKAKVKAETKQEESVAKATDTSTDNTLVENTKVEVDKASVTNDMEKSMEDENLDVVLKAMSDEKVALQKALDEQKEQLTKALESIAKFEQAEKERIAKARKDQIEAAIGDKAQAEVIAKAALLVEDEGEFQAVVKALGAIAEKAKAASDELFVEKGASADVKEEEKPNLVASILKAKSK